MQALRVEFLLKTDSWYSKDTGVTLFTMATPGNPLRYDTFFSFFPSLFWVANTQLNHESLDPLALLVDHRDPTNQIKPKKLSPTVAKRVPGLGQITW